MARETYVLHPVTRKLIPKSEALAQGLVKTRRGYSPVMRDITPFVTTDGTPISSRSHLREYQQRTGLVQTGGEPINPVGDDGGLRNVTPDLGGLDADIRRGFEEAREYKPGQRPRDGDG